MVEPSGYTSKDRANRPVLVPMVPSCAAPRSTSVEDAQPRLLGQTYQKQHHSQQASQHWSIHAQRRNGSSKYNELNFRSEPSPLARTSFQAFEELTNTVDFPEMARTVPTATGVERLDPPAVYRLQESGSNFVL